MAGGCAVRIGERKQLVVLRPGAVREARFARKLRMEDLARKAGVGYGTVGRALAGVAIGRDLAVKVSAALGVDLAELVAADDERRPASGYCDAAMRHFQRLLMRGAREAIESAYRETEQEAGRRCWFWPGPGKIRDLCRFMTNGIEALTEDKSTAVSDGR